MVKKAKLFEKALNSPKNLRFEEFINLLEAFGFSQDRIKGSHRIFVHAETDALLSVQPRKDGKAKPHQVRQFLNLIEHYSLSFNDEDD